MDMPIRKVHLNAAENANYLAAAKELQIGGLDLDIPMEWSQQSRLLDIEVAPGPASMAVDLANAGVGYAICIRLIARQPRLILPHYEITTEWDQQISILDFDERRICKLGSLTYSRDQVLNHELINSVRFHYSGQMIEGMILAMGLRPIPVAYRTGAKVPFKLAFGDSLGREINVEAELYYERTTKRKNTTIRRGAGLYEPLTPREGAAPSARREDLRLGDGQHLETNNPQKLE
jgi:hypothetical protein